MDNSEPQLQEWQQILIDWNFKKLAYLGKQSFEDMNGWFYMTELDLSSYGLTDAERETFKKLAEWLTRTRWQENSQLQVFSHTEEEWCDGVVLSIKFDEEGEWLHVEYDNDKSKDIQRFHADIRPLPIIPRAIMSKPTEHIDPSEFSRVFSERSKRGPHSPISHDSKTEELIEDTKRGIDLVKLKQEKESREVSELRSKALIQEGKVRRLEETIAQLKAKLRDEEGNLNNTRNQLSKESDRLAEQENTLTQQARKKWKKNAFMECWSNSRQTWFFSECQEISEDEEGEWLHVMYIDPGSGQSIIKQIQRYSPDIRPCDVARIPPIGTVANGELIMLPETPEAEEEGVNEWEQYCELREWLTKHGLLHCYFPLVRNGVESKNEFYGFTLDDVRMLCEMLNFSEVDRFWNAISTLEAPDTIFLDPEPENEELFPGVYTIPKPDDLPAFEASHDMYMVSDYIHHSDDSELGPYEVTVAVKDYSEDEIRASFVFGDQKFPSEVSRAILEFFPQIAFTSSNAYYAFHYTGKKLEVIPVDVQNGVGKLTLTDFSKFAIFKVDVKNTANFFIYQDASTTSINTVFCLEQSPDLTDQSLHLSDNALHVSCFWKEEMHLTDLDWYTDEVVSANSDGNDDFPMNTWQISRQSRPVVQLEVISIAEAKLLKGVRLEWQTPEYLCKLFDITPSKSATLFTWWSLHCELNEEEELLFKTDTKPVKTVMNLVSGFGGNFFQQQ